MTIRSIHDSESLETVWDELVYTEARLEKSEHARAHAPLFAALLKRWEKVSAGQRTAWRAEIAAQAAVDEANDDLDDLVDEVDDALQGVTGRDREAPRYRRYFSQSPSSVRRMALERELAVVRTWPQSLATEPETALKAVGRRLQEGLQSGDAAVSERSQAAAARADHRVREINHFIAEVNGTRQSVYGMLVTRGQQAGLPKDWAERFFRKKTTSRSAAETEPTAPTPA